MSIYWGSSNEREKSTEREREKEKDFLSFCIELSDFKWDELNGLSFLGTWLDSAKREELSKGEKRQKYCRGRRGMSGREKKRKSIEILKTK